jgi:hypothetical protein
MVTERNKVEKECEGWNCAAIITEPDQDRCWSCQPACTPDHDFIREIDARADALQVAHTELTDAEAFAYAAIDEFDVPTRKLEWWREVRASRVLADLVAARRKTGGDDGGVQG